VPVADFERGQRRVGHQSGVQEHHVHAAKPVLRQGDDAVVVFLPGHIQRLPDGVPAALRDVICDLFELVRAPRTEHDLGALLGEQPGGGFANTRRCAGDDDDFVMNHDACPLD